MNKQHYEWIDIAKGIGIILVVMGHVSHNRLLFMSIYSFHMPLFFFISGMLFVVARKEGYVKKQIKSLLIPYVIFSVISYIYWRWFELPYRGGNEIVDLNFQFWNIFISQINGSTFLYNVVLWFLPCLFICNLLLYVLFTKTKIKPLWITILFVVIAIICNLVFSKTYPLAMPQVFYALPFMGVGILFMNYFDGEIIIVKNNLLNVFICISFFVILFLFPTHNNIMNVEFGNGYFYFFLIAMFGIYVIVCLSKHCVSKKRGGGILGFLGVNTLLIMCVHEPIKRIILKICSMMTNIDIETLRTNVFSAIAITFIVIFVITPFIIIVNKYVPFIVGKRILHGNKEKKVENRFKALDE